ncbi:MAG TPA: hypothetical protein VEK34_14275 [Methylocella sp.]|nr:hypothetical protein [Methylocella sp.]
MDVDRGVGIVTLAKFVDNLRMERFRQTLKAQCVAIIIIASQAFNAAPLPAMALGSPGEIICAQEGSRSETPASERHHYGLCCILGCAACGVAANAPVSGVATLPARAISSTDWTPTPGIAARAPQNPNYFPRGPPR